MSNYLPTGLHEGVPHSIYHADPSERPSLSSHLAGTLLTRSAAHTRLEHPRFGGAIPEEPTKEMDAGSIIHGMLLGGGPEIVSLDFKDFRKDAAQNARDEARASGKIPMLAHKLAAIRIAADEIRKVLPVDFSKAKTEVTAIWESDGCPCRCRIDSLLIGREAIIEDRLPPDILTSGWAVVDLKTTDDAHLASEARNLYSSGHHRQAAANIDAVETLIPESQGRVTFADLFVENVPPYGWILTLMAGDFRDLGRRQWDRAKGIWAQCLATKTFPSYSPVKTVEAPAWAMTEEMGIAINNAGQPPF